MFTVKLIIREDKNNSVRIRITNLRKSAQFSLGIVATKEDLENALSADANMKLSGVARTLRAYRAKMDLTTDQVVEDGKENEPASTLAEIFKNALLGSGEADIPTDESKSLFLPFFKRCIDSKTNAGYKVSREYTYKTIGEYCKNADSLTFEDIDLKWLNRFDEWLIKKGLKQNSRNIHFKNIRTVINRAIDEELTDKYPFRRFKIHHEETRKRSLATEDIRKLFSCPVEPYQEFYRDMFKLMFMLCGINAIDLYNLTGIVNGRIEYRRAKTKRLYSIKVEPEVMEIINRWKGSKRLLCIADRWSSHKDFTKWMNVALKKIGNMEIVGRGGKKEIKPYWPELSAYWCRHSWSTVAYTDLDIPKDVIAQSLGHGKKTVTDIYLDKDQRKIDEANRRVLDWVLYGKK